VQNGDLETGFRERLVIVLEGVLALVDEQHGSKRRRLRTTETVTYHLQWHEIPIKRLIVTKERYPHYEIQVVTFISPELLDLAAQYLQRMNVPVDEFLYQDLDEFVTMLPYQHDLRAVYDSIPENLDRYGQVGVAVVRGSDW
jgi:hypothetical protein